MVHQPTAVQGQTPVTIGHSYSMIAALSDRDEGDARWTIPLDIERVFTNGAVLSTVSEVCSCSNRVSYSPPEPEES